MKSAVSTSVVLALAIGVVLFLGHWSEKAAPEPVADSQASQEARPEARPPGPEPDPREPVRVTPFQEAVPRDDARDSPTAPTKPEFPVLVGRLVRADGTPWSGLRVDVLPRLHPPPRQISVRHMVVDAEGGFRLPVFEPLPSGGTRAFSFVARGSGSEEPDSGPILDIDLSREIPLGDHDLGVLRLDYGPVVVQGRVVDAEGAPVEGASVRLFGSSEEATVRGPGAEPEQIVASSGTDGSFRLRRRKRAPFNFFGSRIVVSHPDYPEARLRDIQDERRLALEIVLEHGGALRGWIRPPANLRPTDLTIYVHSPAGVAPVSPTADWRFWAGGIPAGTATVEVRWSSAGSPFGGTPLFAADAIRIIPGTTTDDPRLQDIDLHGEFHRATALVTDRAGTPIPGAWAEARAGGALIRSVAGEDGRAEFVVPFRAYELTVGSRGWMSRRLAGTPGDNVVALERAIDLVVRTAIRQGPADPGYRLCVQASPVQGKVPLPGSTGSATVRAPFDDRGEAILKFDWPGTYELRPALQLPWNRPRGGLVLDSLPPITVTIAPDQLPPPLTLPLDPTAIDAALARQR